MVIKQKNNGKWEYCIYLGLDEMGKKKYKRKSGFLTKKDCLREANKIKNNKELKRSYKTFEDICELYIQDCELRFLRSTTIYNYQMSIRFIEIHFKQYKEDVKKITTQHVKDFITLCKTITHRGTTRNLIIKLKSIFNFAKKNKYIDNDIFSEIMLPPIYTKNKLIWSKKDLEEYIPILEKFKYFDVIMLMLETGLRRSELCALTWDCVDLDTGLITINKSYVIAGNLKIINHPKTKSGIRNIVLLNRSLEIIKARNMNKKSQYVFYDNKDFKKPLNPAILYRTFTYFLQKNGIKRISLHDLRHIHATLLLNNNIDYKMLSKRLGHSNVAFTLQTYTHILPEYEINVFKNIPNLF